MALVELMAQLSEQKCRAPGANEVFAEILTSFQRLYRKVVMSTWQACGRLSMILELLFIELVKPIFKDSDHNDYDRSLSPVWTSVACARCN